MEKQLLNLVAENHIPDVDFVLQTTDYCMDYSQPARNNKPECDKNVSPSNDSLYINILMTRWTWLFEV